MSGVTEQIEQLARDRLPAWRFDQAEPDGAVALALVFARLYEGSLTRFAQMPYNHRVALFNKLDGGKLSAAPAKGELCVQLAGDGVEGAELPEGFRFFSPPLDDAGTRLSVETQAKVTVTAAALAHTVRCHPEGDYLSYQPSGGVNAQLHRLTLRHALFDRADSAVRLYLHADGPNAARWRALLCDGTLCGWTLVRGGVVYPLTCHRLLDARMLLRGFPDAPGESAVRLTVTNVAPFLGLTLAALSLSAEGAALRPDAVVSQGELLEGAARQPFGSQWTGAEECYIQCDRALTQAGAMVTATLMIDFETERIGGVPPLPPPPKRFLLRKQELAAPPVPDMVLDEVAWEYFNGAGFAPLQLRHAAAAAFRGADEQGQLAAPAAVTLEFPCPEDMQPMLTGPSQGYFLRARVKRVRSLFASPARVVIPVLQSLQFSFRYDSPLPIASVEVEHDGVSAPCSAAPVFGGQSDESGALYLGFARPPEAGTLGLYLQCAGGSGGAVCQSLGADGWTVLNTTDGTDGFTHDGLLLLDLPSPPPPRPLFGRTGCWLRLCCPQHTRFLSIKLNAVPVLQCESVKGETFYTDRETRRLRLKHPNVIDLTVRVCEQSGEEEQWHIWREHASDGRQIELDRAEGIITVPSGLSPDGSGRAVKADYRHGGGTLGNLPEGTVFIPALSIGYVVSAVNPAPLSGGTELETDGEALARMSRALRHGGRCITAADYRDLAYESGVALVDCRADGRDVMLTVLLEDFRAPQRFDELRRRVITKLTPLLPLGTERLTVRPPEFVWIDVRLRVAGRADEVRQLVRRLCDPVQFGTRYGLGKLPDPALLTREISALTRCLGLQVRYRVGETEVDAVPSLALPLPGELEVTVC